MTAAEQRPLIAAGRKHQIRIHCAQLGAPVVGDSRHGVTRGPAQDALANSVAPAVRRLLKGRLMLHARSIRITRPVESRAALLSRYGCGEDREQPG